MTIPDIILRLARRHLPVDAAATEHSSAQLEPELPDLAAAPLAQPPRTHQDELAEPTHLDASEAPPTTTDLPGRETAVTAPNPAAFFVDPSTSAPVGMQIGKPHDIQTLDDQTPQHAILAPDVSQRAGTPHAPIDQHAGESPFAPSDRESVGGIEPAFMQAGSVHPSFQQPRFEQPAFDQSGDFAPSFPARIGLPRAIDNQSDDSFEPLDRSTPAASGSQNQSSVDAVTESSRQLEQTARDLETSLTRLFTTQIETLQRLRDRVDEQERRWVEQQSARRGTL